MCPRDDGRYTASLFVLTVSYVCQDKLVTVQPEIETEEPGTCHCGDYCYCSPTEVSAVIQRCAVCGKRHFLDIKYYTPRDARTGRRSAAPNINVPVIADAPPED